jgi:hypothetical protein
MSAQTLKEVAWQARGCEPHLSPHLVPVPACSLAHKVHAYQVEALSFFWFSTPSIVLCAWGRVAAALPATARNCPQRARAWGGVVC